MDQRLKVLIGRTWGRQLAFTLFLAALLFVPAGTLAYWQAWAFLCVFIGSSFALGFYFAKHDPALLERRMNAGPSAEKEPVQKIIIGLLLSALVLMLVVAAFDYGQRGATVAPWLAILADLGIAASFLVFFAVMKQNSYAASTIRVEAGQPVISSGLYAVVRHPMYAGALLLSFCVPLALGSVRSLALFVVVIPILAWRLLDEERYLKENLPGYTDYCARVRSRLIPAIW